MSQIGFCFGDSVVNLIVDQNTTIQSQLGVIKVFGC